MSWHTEVAEIVGKENIIREFPLKRLCTIKVGGKADALVWIDDLNSLKRVTRFLKENEVPYFVIGNGSNILPVDKGFKGAILKLRGEFLRLDFRRNTIRVGSALKLNALLRECIRSGKGGLEFLSGIPGSIGGAIRMNAGGKSGEICERINRLTMFSLHEDRIIELQREEIRYEYRNIGIPKGYIFLEAELLVENSPSDSIKRKIRDVYIKKKVTQPLNLPSCGCIFKNPVGYSAGRLIEDAGLKGMRRGDAMISTLHGNFILNLGNATSSDILYLIDLCRAEVKKRFNIQLNLEIEILDQRAKW